MSTLNAWFFAGLLRLIRWWHGKSANLDLNLSMKLGFTETYRFGISFNFNMLPCQFSCCGRYYHFWNWHLTLNLWNVGTSFDFGRRGIWLDAFELQSVGWYRNTKDEPEFDEHYERVTHLLWDWKYPKCYGTRL